MSIAEKLTTIAENEQKVFRSGLEKGKEISYNIGYEEGHEVGYREGYNGGQEAGKNAEYDRFWDNFQQNGAKHSYIDGFSARNCWNMEIYNPKYPILATSCESLFNNGAWLTDTLVPIELTGTLDYGFPWCTELVTIRKLKVAKATKYTNTFKGCSKLANVTFDGEIGQNISFEDCNKLTKDSLLSIINHLYDFVTTGEGGTHTCTLGSTNLAKLSDTEKAIATQKGWTLA